MRVKVTQELTNAWEVWEYEVPDDTNVDDLSDVPLDNGNLIDSGFDSAAITDIEVVSS